MKVPSVSLVIQGPMVSEGRTGSRYFEGGFVKYECMENIVRVLDQYGPLFEGIVVVLTDKDQTETFVKKIGGRYSNVKVIQMDDNDITSKIVKRSSLNKYRQFYSSFIGVDYIEKEIGSDLTIKVRTDQYLDLDALLNEYLTVLDENSEANYIMAPQFFGEEGPQKRCSLPDLYYIAKTIQLREFFFSIIDMEFLDFVGYVHSEIYFKYAYSLNGKIYNLDDRVFFPRTSCYLRGQEEIEATLYREIFLPGPKKVFESLEWRGSTISNGLVENNYYLEEWINGIKERFLSEIPESRSTIRLNVLNMVALVNVNYFLFRHPVLRKSKRVVKSIDFMQKLVSKIYLMFNKNCREY